jgi:hypothetical protein
MYKCLLFTLIMAALLNHTVSANNDSASNESTESNSTEQESEEIEPNDEIKRGTPFRWGKRGTPFRWGKRGTPFRWGKRSNIQELCKKVLSKIQQNHPNVEIDEGFLASTSNAYDANVLRVCLRLSKTKEHGVSFRALNSGNPVFKWGKRDDAIDLSP